METPQAALFMESIYDALSEAVKSLGGAKAVGAKLWPQKSVHDARALLLHCLNPDRHEKLDPEQVLLILRWARDGGHHAAKHWIDREIGYHPSEPSSPQEEEEVLANVIANAAETMQRAMVQLERLDQRRATRPTSLRSA